MSQPQYPPPSGPPQPGWGAPPPAPAPAPRKSGAGKIVGFGCLGIVLLSVLFAIIAVAASGGGGGGDDPKPGAGMASADAPATHGDDGAREAAAGPTGDVRLTACEIEAFTTWPSAKLTITNRSSKTSNYMVQVEFVDAKGTRISEGFAATNNLRPGQIAEEEAQGTAEATGKVTCRVTDVTRYAS
ncbi:FxLYD domain-containing protein [Streptomyces sp. MI02-7b]|uniref:FxLYD domain-containing protein n=1 Tax=Streptomyces sp. MI02-7b TaxID=462941 RepID=UPI0029BC809C|nr:FxLYD domain-containing protein [Streptomyces sp. MI02-7b]MDX3073555.1 FxLYD domain-containing protein [Streptomyces sp. MI02-7b]